MISITSFIKKIKSSEIYSLILIGIFALILITGLLVQIEVDGEFTCNSGFIGLDVEVYNNIQNKTCEYDGNYTCFKEDLQIKHIKIKNIDELNCYGKTKTKIPLLIGLFFGN